MFVRSTVTTSEHCILKTNEPISVQFGRGVYTIESLEQMLQKNFRGGRFDVEPGGNVFKKNICRLAAVIFSGFSDKQIVRAKDSTLCKTSRYLLTYA